MVVMIAGKKYIKGQVFKGQGEIEAGEEEEGKKSILLARKVG
jgi:hypothetical protein